MVDVNSRIKHLDGMRGIAILLVLFFHTFVRWPELLPFVQQTKDIYLFKYGHIGVRFFFIISGFVIFMSLDNTKNIASFFKKRWLRLFPSMLIASVFIYLTAHFFHERPAGIPHLVNLIPGLTFISPDIIRSVLSVNVNGLEGAFWSLYVEVMFYIFAGLIYFKVGRKHLLKSIFIPAFFSCFLYYFTNLTMEDKLIKFVVYIGFDSYVWFFMGCFMYEKIHGRADKIDHAMMLLTVVSCLIAPHKQPGLVVLTAMIIGLFCFSFYCNPIKRILSNKTFLFFGFISYPLYLIHENMIVSASIKFMKAIDFGSYGYLSTIIPILMVTTIAYGIAKIEPKTKYLFISIRELLIRSETEKN